MPGLHLAASLALLLTQALGQIPVLDISAKPDLEARLGQKVIITGTVERVTTLSQNDQRLFFQGDSEFYVFLHRDRRETLGGLDLNRFLNQTIFVAGRVTDFRGKPQIVLEDFRQIGPSAETVAMPIVQPWPPPMPTETSPAQN